jgi:hypothetical protein
MDVLQELKDARGELARAIANQASEGTVSYRRDEVSFYERLLGPAAAEIVFPAPDLTKEMVPVPESGA